MAEAYPFGYSCLRITLVMVLKGVSRIRAHSILATHAILFRYPSLIKAVLWHVDQNGYTCVYIAQSKRRVMQMAQREGDELTTVKLSDIDDFFDKTFFEGTAESSATTTSLGRPAELLTDAGDSSP